MRNCAGGFDSLLGPSSNPNHQFVREDLRVWLGCDQASVIGVRPWLLYDFRSERRQTVFNQGFNRKGLITARLTCIKLLQAPKPILPMRG